MVNAAELGLFVAESTNARLTGEVRYSMGISARLENHSGRCLAEVLDPTGLLNWLLLLQPLDATVCLKFIDPYGDTVFNPLQLPVLRLELERLVALLSEDNVDRAKRQYLERAKTWPDAAYQTASTYTASLSVDQLRAHLDKLVALVAQGIEEGPHHYCRFVGD